MVWCAYGTGLWIGGRATGSARRTGNEGLCATYVARLAMTEKEVWHKHHGRSDDTDAHDDENETI